MKLDSGLVAICSASRLSERLHVALRKSSKISENAL